LTITNRPTTIYALLDPRDAAVRYIGKTIQTPAARLRRHLQRRFHTRKGCWISQLKEQGLKPIWQTLEVIPAGEGWEARECWWIAHGRNEGWPLTNIGDGGEGRSPHTKSAATRQKQSDAVKAAWRRGAYDGRDTEEFRHKISEAHKGKTLSKEHRRKIGDAFRGKVLTKEHKQKIGKANGGENNPFFGKHHSEETRARYRIINKGAGNPRAKLTEKEVIRIRARWANDKITQAALAREYGITRAAVWRIVHRITWTHV